MLIKHSENMPHCCIKSRKMTYSAFNAVAKSVCLWSRRLQWPVKRSVLSVFIDLRYAECVCVYYGRRVCSQTIK